jgi:hypothetical protein
MSISRGIKPRSWNWPYEFCPPPVLPGDYPCSPERRLGRGKAKGEPYQAIEAHGEANPETHRSGAQSGEAFHIEPHTETSRVGTGQVPDPALGPTSQSSAYV